MPRTGVARVAATSCPGDDGDRPCRPSWQPADPAQALVGGRTPSDDLCHPRAVALQRPRLEPVVVTVDVGEPMPGTGGELVLSWTPDDPLSVVLAVRSRGPHLDFRGGRWTVLVDTFQQALRGGPAGDGDVRFRPARRADQVLLFLTDAAGCLALDVPRRPLLLFGSLVLPQLPWTEWQVQIALDEELERLLQDPPETGDV